MKRALALAAMVVALAVACDPAPTTTIQLVGASKASCGGYIDLGGTVTPATATTQVVLQRTVNGKWQDWLWYETEWGMEKAHRVTADVQQGYGTFAMSPRAPLSVGRTYSLRVRSKGGSVVSNTLWVTVQAPSTGSCPASMP